MTTNEKQKKYWSLRDLAQRCPAKVNGEKITGATRRILECIASHCDGNTVSTFVGRIALMREVRCSKGTLDKGLARLKRSGLLSTTEQHYDPRNQTSRNATRTLDRALLEKEVARGAAEDLPREEEKKHERVCRRLLKSLASHPFVTYGPTTRKDAVAVGRCLKRLAGGDLVIKGKNGSPDPEGQATTILVIRAAETKAADQGEQITGEQQDTL
jgi:hypothetical protein